MNYYYKYIKYKTKYLKCKQLNVGGTLVSLAVLNLLKDDKNENKLKKIYEFNNNSIINKDINISNINSEFNELIKIFNENIDNTTFFNDTYKNEQKKLYQIYIFIQKVFFYLNIYKMSFVKGTIIFGDNNNHLYNFLTCGIKNGICDKFIFKKISTHWTIDNKNVFDKPDVISNDKKFTANSALILHPQACRNNKCLKLVLSFDIPIIYGWHDYIINKKVLLFYRFQQGENKYIFFKLKNNNFDESDSNDMLDKHTKLNSYYYQNNFRENKYMSRLSDLDEKNNYMTDQDQVYYNENGTIYKANKIYDDKNFNKRAVLTDKNKIEIDIDNYNLNLRTGHEVYICNKIKDFLLDNELL
jgi:hypothetical protein